MKLQKFFRMDVADWATLFDLLTEYITRYLGLSIASFCQIHKLEPSTINKRKTTARRENLSDKESNTNVTMKTLDDLLKALDGRISLSSSTGESWELDCLHPVGLEVLRLVYPHRFEGKKPIRVVRDDTTPFATMTSSASSISASVAITREIWNEQCMRGEMPTPKEEIGGLRMLLDVFRCVNIHARLELPEIEHQEVVLPSASLPTDRKLPVLRGVYSTDPQRHLILDHAVYHIPVDAKRGITKKKFDGRCTLLYLRPTRTYLEDRLSSPSKHFEQPLHFPCGLYLIDAHPTEMTRRDMETAYRYHSTKKPSTSSSTPRYLVFKLLAQLPLPFPTTVHSLAESRSGSYRPSTTTLGHVLNGVEKRG